MTERQAITDQAKIKAGRDAVDTYLEAKDGFVKTYKSEARSVVIEKDDKSSMLDMALASSYRMMVGAGKSVRVAEIRLNDWTGKHDLFDELGFYNRKDSHKMSKAFTLKYAEDKTVTVTEPIPDGSGEEFSFDVVRPDWDNAVELKKLGDLPHKDISIGIYTETVLGEKVEWLPTIDGFDVHEWAAYDVTQIDVDEHDTGYGTYNSLVMIDATHFILAYAGSDGDGFIKTFSINGSHVITEIDSLEHDTDYGTYNSLVMIDATHFILAYTGSAGDGFIKTFSIDGSYDNIAQIDSLEHDTVQGTYNSLVMIDATHFILAYTGTADYDGFIKTFSIDGSYASITEIDSLEHDTVNGAANSLVVIDATHCILAYAGVDYDGFIKTFSIEAPVVTPTVTTQAADTIVPGGATLNGNITDDGGASITQHGFCWKAGSDPVNIAGADGSSELGAGTEGAFDQAKTGLTEATAFYVRAYAINSDSTAYGAAVSFTTGQTHEITLGITALGAVGAELVCLFVADGTIAGLGSLADVLSIRLTPSGSAIQAAGNVTDVVPVCVWEGSVTIDAEGAVVNTPIYVFVSAASIDALGAVIIGVFPDVFIQSTIKGTGNVADVVGASVLEGAAAIEAVGEAGSAAVFLFVSEVGISAQGEVDVSISPDVFIQSAIDTIGQVATVPAVIWSSAASIDALGAVIIIVPLYPEVLIQAALTAMGEVTADLVSSLAALSDISGTGEVTASPTVLAVLASDIVGQSEAGIIANTVLAASSSPEALGAVAIDYIRARETSATILSTPAVGARAVLRAILTSGISGASTVSSLPNMLSVLESSLTAQGDVLIGVFPDVFIQSVIDASGEVSVAPNLVAALTTAIEAQGGVVSEIQIATMLAAAIEAAGTCDGNPTMIAVTGSALSGIGEASAGVVFIAALESSPSATGAVVAAPVFVMEIEAALDATGIVSAIPTKTWFETFTYSGSILAGSELVIDGAEMTVKLDGVNARKDFLGAYWEVVPGVQSVIYSDEDVSRAVTLTITRKDRKI